MPDTGFRRHDLVWLDPDWPLRAFGLQAAERGEAERWIARGLPFVVARQDAGLPGVRLGFTIPGTGLRRRVGLQVPREAIVRHEQAPLLSEMIAHAPPHWREGLSDLLRECSGRVLVPRVFGSLVTEAYSGEACLREGSDLDLLIACRSPNAVGEALSALRAHGERMPRIDAELRLKNGDAVAWRELERAIAAKGVVTHVLVKSDTAARLAAVEQFLA